MQNPEPSFLTADQVGTRLQISRSTLLRLIARGQFPAPTRLGRLLRWPLALVEQWESDQLQPA